MAAEHDPIERQVFIPARPETIFRFLVEPELMARWIGRVQFAAAQEGGLFRLTPKNHADRWSHYLSRLADAVDR